MRDSLRADGGFYFEQLAFSSDGRKLAAAAGHSVVVWDLVKNRVVFSPQVHTRAVYGVAISPDGRFVAAAAQGPVVCRPIGPFGLLGVACVAEGGRVKLWGLETDPNGREFSEKGTTYAVAFSPDGRTLASGGRAGARLRNLPEGRGARFSPTRYSASRTLLTATPWPSGLGIVTPIALPVRYGSGTFGEAGSFQYFVVKSPGSAPWRSPPTVVPWSRAAVVALSSGMFPYHPCPSRRSVVLRIRRAIG